MLANALQNNILTSNNLLSAFWQGLSSSTAIVIYIIILSLIMIFLVVTLMINAIGQSNNTVVHIKKDNTDSTTESESEVQSNVKKNAKTKAISVEVEDDGNNVRERFYMLGKIDAEYKKYQRASYDKGVTLKRFCDTFRDYACAELNLYYDIDDIRRFIAGLAVSHIIILQGMSGTGKTSLAFAFGEFLDNSSTVIPVQPMWKERTDLIGYYNEFTKRFNETTLLYKMYEANYSKDIYVTVMDEMNIARVEYYFAEFLSLLELPNPEKRYLDVVSDKWPTDPKQFKKGQIKLPENMWFIGTANNDDSTFAISDKVYDRAMVLNLDQKTEPFVAPRTSKTHLSYEQFAILVKEAIKEYAITARNYARLDKLDKYLMQHFHITFGNRIMKQIKTYIPAYVACGGEELDALDDIVSKKVLRKLEMQNPIYVKNESEGFLTFLDELFGDGRMKLCKAFIERLQKNV